MLILRLLTIAIWAVVLVYMAPAVWALFKGKPRRGDPHRMLSFSVSVIMVLGNLRWLLVPDDDQLWAAIYALCIGTGIYALVVARTYGRGPHVH